LKTTDRHIIAILKSFSKQVFMAQRHVKTNWK